MKLTYRKFYLLSSLAIILASIYPIRMGVLTLYTYFEKGFINSDEYPKYIIPYTPLCIALIVSVLLMPIVIKIFKKHTLLVSSIVGTVIFFLCEFGFEQLKIVEGYKTLQLQSWQYSLCRATPEVLKAIGEPIFAQNNPAFKIHFYLIALVIILAVINVIYGFSKMIIEKNYDKKMPLIVQLISVIIFIGLCILACLTSFYRNGTINISPISSILMSFFFIVFGVAFGTYFGSIFYRKNKFLSVILPSIISAITTIIMYIGELILTDGVLFKFGTGFIFEPLGVIPFAIIDITVILLSGMITYFIMASLFKFTMNKVNQ